MRARRPHYFLRTQAAAPPAPPRWAFSLQAAANLGNEIQSPPITAGDLEPNASWERLQLLAVVRGLEALPEPALVTLTTASDVVRRGIRHGLEEWRSLDWQLELFGELIPVKNADLWKRIDRALNIHDVQIRNVRVDEPIATEQSEQPHFAQATNKSRRAQPAFAGSSKLSHGSDSLHQGAVDNHPHNWSTETTIRHESWDSASEWHTSDDEDHYFGYHNESFDDRVAQHSGNHLRNRLVAKNTLAIRKQQIPQNSAVQPHPGYTISLLRVRRRIRASRLHLQRRIGELWSSWVWFYEVSGLQQMTRSRKPVSPPWLRDQLQRERPSRY